MIYGWTYFTVRDSQLKAEDLLHHGMATFCDRLIAYFLPQRLQERGRREYVILLEGVQGVLTLWY